MKNNTLQNEGSAGAAITWPQSIKLGLEVHADSIVAVRIVDGQTPQPAQRFKAKAFLAWIQKPMARQFAIDWWRIRTGRAKPNELGLVI